MRVNTKKKADIDLGKKPTLQNVNLLDRSGSMDEGKYQNTGSKYDNAVNGINEEQNMLKEDKTANYLQTIIEFDSLGNFRYGKDAKDIARYNEALITQPIETCGIFKGKGADGGTPLYDAIGYTIRKLLILKKPEDRVLLKIFTDGGENSSTGEFNPHTGGAKKLYDLIQDVQNNHKFTVTFMGTKYDTETIIKKLGIDRGNTLVHDNTAHDVKMSYARAAGQTISFANEVATKGVDTVANFYSKSVEK